MSPLASQFATTTEDEALPGGSFVEESARFLPLFRDPDARGARRWAAIFDPSQCEEADAGEILDQLPSLSLF